MPLADRYDRTAAVKRGNGTLTSDGAGGYRQGATTIASAVKYARWLPNAHARTTVRTEQGLKPDAEVFYAHMEYSTSVELRDRDWLVETGTGYVFRLVGVQCRKGFAAVAHHWAAVLVKLNTEPVE